MTAFQRFCGVGEGVTSAIHLILPNLWPATDKLKFDGFSCLYRGLTDRLAPFLI